MAGSGDSDDEKRPRKKSGTATIAKKFTMKCKEYKKLEKMFRDQKIAPCDKPSSIRSKDIDYQQFTPTQFRSQFNKLKGMYGTTTKEGMYVQLPRHF